MESVPDRGTRVYASTTDISLGRPQRLFEVDGGYVVLCSAGEGLATAQGLSKAFNVAT
jgi:hypothetical protein